MRRRLLLSATTALLATACVPDAGSEARPDQTPPSAQETLPPDAGELEDPQQVVEPGHGEDGSTSVEEPNEASDG